MSIDLATNLRKHKEKLDRLEMDHEQEVDFLNRKIKELKHEIDSPEMDICKNCKYAYPKKYMTKSKSGIRRCGRCYEEA